MLDFRPHRLEVVTFTSGGFDENGVPLPDTESVESMHCHIASDRQAEQARYLDGISFNYSYMIYLDQDCRKFERGERIRLYNLDGEIINDKRFEVLGFFRHQLNAHLWV